MRSFIHQLDIVENIKNSCSNKLISNTILTINLLSLAASIHFAFCGIKAGFKIHHMTGNDAICLYKMSLITLIPFPCCRSILEFKYLQLMHSLISQNGKPGISQEKVYLPQILFFVVVSMQSPLSFYSLLQKWHMPGIKLEDQLL